jgi:DtxR family Mn-dependent transcriptional regulator
MEDYLEAIAKLGEGRKVVKVKQVSQMLGVKMPSVTSALKKLSEQELVEHERYGRIKLTAAGDESARAIISRHEALTRFFAQALGIDQETAEADACKIEHVISPLSMERLTKFVEFMEACPLTMADFSGRYEYYLGHGELPQECSNKGVKRRKREQ